MLTSNLLEKKKSYFIIDLKKEMVFVILIIYYVKRELCTSSKNITSSFGIVKVNLKKDYKKLKFIDLLWASLA